MPLYSDIISKQSVRQFPVIPSSCTIESTVTVPSLPSEIIRSSSTITHIFAHGATIEKRATIQRWTKWLSSILERRTQER